MQFCYIWGAMTDARPQDLIWTLYGEFLLHRAGPVWVGSLIRLLKPLGVSEAHTRTLLSRMTSKGWLEASRLGRRAYYTLSTRGQRLLEEGEARIYRPERASAWDGEWTLLAYSIPEGLRPLRDRLRVRLSWLGFGSLGNGLWISPHDVREQVRGIGAALGVTEHLQVFRGRYDAHTSAAALALQCWDLPALNARYDSFIARHLPDYQHLASAGTTELAPRDAYVRRFSLVHEYRQFALLDPFLPRPLQTADWAGECAQALFQAYHALLSEPADRFLSKAVETLEPKRRVSAH